MGWEKRRGTLCYYRKVRVGGKVRSVYIGSGERGEAAAREDAERRAAGVRPVPPPPAGGRITRSEIVRRAELTAARINGEWSRRCADKHLALGEVSSALRLAGIDEKEVARRGLDIAGAYSSFPHPPARADEVVVTPKGRGTLRESMNYSPHGSGVLS